MAVTTLETDGAHADHFLKVEKQFHLGMLPTEQPHPVTMHFSEVARQNPGAGIAMLQEVDHDVVGMAQRVFASPEYSLLVDTLGRALREKKKIHLSGCGATGRLAILLESAWRDFWHEARLRLGTDFAPASVMEAEQAVGSFMTGGDYALVRSVEGFEDYQSFGREQSVEAGVGPGDVFVALNEGGETSSVIGSAWQALEAGAQVFFPVNNPPSVLAETPIERTQRVMGCSDIVKLDLSSGPMAILGSTRMQASTSHLLVIGAALETALVGFLQDQLSPDMCERLRLAGSPADPAGVYRKLLGELSEPMARETLASWAVLEAELYQRANAMTYFSEKFLLDIFTDTTERSPTFCLAPFRKFDDRVSNRPLAFVKHPTLSTGALWPAVLHRDARCLDWDANDYIRLHGAPANIQHPPQIGHSELLKFLIGNEDDPSRSELSGDAASLVLAGSELDEHTMDGAVSGFESCAKDFSKRYLLTIGTLPPGFRKASFESTYHIPCSTPYSPLRIAEHLAVKLAFNALSTTTAALVGRLSGNLMTHVDTSNKKLIDRGIRILSVLTGLDYADACYEIHQSRAELAESPLAKITKISPVAHSLSRLAEHSSIDGANQVQIQ
jgi:N-acetylmuramic acid 6-phosphate etherase